MFSGIVEATGQISDIHHAEKASRIRVSKPPQFDDLEVGHSIAVNGVCLTVEEFDEKSMQFCMGPETLKVTGWNKETLQEVNLERSLQIGERLHGHIVTGHVDAMGKVLRCDQEGETLTVEIEFPAQLESFIWEKGSVCVNGVSLTINAVTEKSFYVGLIPETLKRTNLHSLKPELRVTLEIDNFARGWLRMKELQRNS